MKQKSPVKSSLTQSQIFTHPCIGCGACCAFYRVAFYWRETEGVTNENENIIWIVPIHLTVDLNDFLKAMKGTEEKHHPHCIALKGRIGQNACCGIYANRPTPCRKFAASFENGKENIRCSEARKGHGLKPLSRESWVREYPQIQSTMTLKPQSGV